MMNAAVGVGARRSIVADIVVATLADTAVVHAGADVFADEEFVAVRVVAAVAAVAAQDAVGVVGAVDFARVCVVRVDGVAAVVSNCDTTEVAGLVVSAAIGVGALETSLPPLPPHPRPSPR